MTVRRLVYGSVLLAHADLPDDAMPGAAHHRALHEIYTRLKTPFATVSVSHDSVPWPALDFPAFQFGLIDHHCFDLYRLS
jgi:hypothetical protein